MKNEMVAVLVLAPVAYSQGLDFDDEVIGLMGTFYVSPEYCLSEIGRLARIGVIRATSRLRIIPPCPELIYGGEECAWEYVVEAP